MEAISCRKVCENFGVCVCVGGGVYISIQMLHELIMTSNAKTMKVPCYARLWQFIITLSRVNNNLYGQKVQFFLFRSNGYIFCHPKNFQIVFFLFERQLLVLFVI